MTARADEDIERRHIWSVPVAGGTPPTDFENDRAKLSAAMERFGSVPGSARGPHPVLGPLSHEQWMRWGYRHADHHLRQFGV